MVDLASQRTAIATALAGISGLRVDAEGLWPDRTNLPAANIRPGDNAAPMNLTFTTWAESYEVVVVHSLAGGLARGQRGLDALYDDVVAALAANLAGLCNISRQAYGGIEVDGAEFLGFVLRLEMLG
jgi:hypothetical protein